MWYIVFNLIFAIWVLVDSRKRKANALFWTIGTLLLGPIVLCVYFAKRPLMAGEVREGGTAWNIVKNFAFFWTILMLFAAVWGIISVSEDISTSQSEVGKAGAIIGTALGLGVIATLWFFPMVGAVVLGFFLKKSSVVEKGPTGPLATVSAENEQSAIPTKNRLGLAGWIGIVVLGLIVLGVIGNLLNEKSGVKQGTQMSTSQTSKREEKPAISNKGVKQGTQMPTSQTKSALTVVDFDWKIGPYGDKYIVGTVKNNSGRQYSYVQVEFNLYDESGAQVGSTFANVRNLEPYGTWKFEAIVFEEKATRAKLKGVIGF
jgi:hypothetical protein